MKKSVIFVGLLLVLSSIVYSIEISWPGNVPFGNAFHDNLYVNVIASAEGDDIIDINASLDLGEWVISGNGSGLYGLNVDGLTIGDIIIGTDEDGNLEIEGNLIIGDALFVGVINTSIIYTNELHAFNFVRSTQYCNYDGSLCVDLEGLSDTPGLLAVLGVSADASGFTEEIRIGGALNVGNPLTVWDGENYIELNSGGDFYAIQSNQNVRISGPSAGDLTELKLGAITTSVSGDLNVGGIITGDGSGLSGTANSLNVNTAVTADFWDSYDTPDGWDLDVSDDLDLLTQFGGDVEGIYTNLQLKVGVVGENEIDFGEVTLQDFTNDGNGGGAPFITNPNDNVDSDELSDGLCNTDGSLLKKVDGTWVCYTEADPVFSLWDKSDGVLVTESQITDLNHFTTGDEIDPQVGSTTSDKICYGTGTVIECDRDILITASNEIQFGSGGPKIYVDGNELIIDIG